MIRLITTLLLFIFYIGISADERTYQRKSISSPQMVIITDTQSTHSDLIPNSHTLGKKLEDKLLLKRFDHNALSETVLAPLRLALDDTDGINSNKIAQLVKGYIVNDILSYLNDDAIQKERASAIKKDERRVTLAQTKGKTTSLTESDLHTLMNSAYIYFPYITEIKESILQREDTARVKETIYGGMLWYRILTDGNGKKDIVEIAHITASGSGSTNVKMPEIIDFFKIGKNKKKEKDHKKKYRKLRSKDLSPSDFRHAFYGAFNNWASNLTLKIKNIDDFKIRAPVKELLGSTYLVDLQLGDGIRTDDTFFLMHYVEENGVEKPKKVGFGRVSKLAPSESTNSKFDQILGNSQVAGGWIEEYPRSGISVEFSFGMMSNIELFPESFTATIPLESNPNLSKTKQVLSSASKKGKATQLRINKNLAPYTNISQFFVFMDIGFGSINIDNASNTTGSATLSNVNIGLSKKFWFKSRSIGIHTGIGPYTFRYSGIAEGSNFSYKITSTTFNTGLSIDQQITPNWAGFFKMNLHARLGSEEFSHTVNGYDVVNNTFEEGGNDIYSIDYLVGVKYDLKSFSIMNSLDGIISFFEFFY
jgi:hypothetical protein